MKRTRFAIGVIVLLLASLSLSADEGAPVWRAALAKYLELSRSEHNHAFKEWNEVAAWSFDDGKMPDGFKAFDGEWEVAGGKLRAVRGKADGNRVVGIANCQWPAFRIEFEASLTAVPGALPERVCDVGILLNASATDGHYRDGYGVLVGTYFNQATVLYRLHIPYARTEFTPIVPGKVHRVALEVVKPHIRLFVDGKIVLEAWERSGKGAIDGSDWLDMDPKRLIALHTYDTVMEVDNLRILTPPASPAQ